MAKFDQFGKGQIANNRKIFLSKEELNRLYWKENLTSGQIAKKYGVHHTTILNWLKHYGIPIKKCGSQIKKFSLTREELHDLYHNKKLSIEKICKRIGLSPGSLHRWMKIYNIPRRTHSELTSGKNNPAYKNGLPHCMDCGKELSNYNIKKCQPCYHKWMTGKNHPFYGKKQKKESIEKIRKSKKGQIPWTKGLTKETDERVRKISETLKGRKHSKERVRNILRGMNVRPNKPEQRFIEIIKKHNLPYKYVGDGQFILGGKCPDFINNNKEKTVIEIFGDYWHDPKKVRIPHHRTYKGTMEHYKKYGFKCIIFWQSELDDEKKVIERISGKSF